MRVDLTIECKQVGEIDPWSPHRLDVSLVGADLDSAIDSVGLDKLLNHIGENALIEHLEGRGFKITDEQ